MLFFRAMALRFRATQHHAWELSRSNTVFIVLATEQLRLECSAVKVPEILLSAVPSIHRSLKCSSEVSSWSVWRCACGSQWWWTDTFSPASTSLWGRNENRLILERKNVTLEEGLKCPIRHIYQICHCIPDKMCLGAILAATIVLYDSCTLI